MKLQKPTFKQVSDTIFIIGTLTLMVLSGYKMGFRNGEISQCDQLNSYKLKNGTCINKVIYDEKLKVLEEMNNPQVEIKMEDFIK
jgi:hypothetical protein